MLTSKLLHPSLRHFGFCTRGFQGAIDTIYALSTPMGKSGLAIIRISGAQSQKIALELTAKELPKPRVASLRTFRDPIDGDIIDKGILLWFAAPRSATGEDIVELHLHGGMSVINDTLSVLSKMQGTRCALPGEFSKRALLAGKMDLLEIEGLADLIHANTTAQRKQALKQLQGSSSSIFEEWRRSVLSLLAHIVNEILQLSKKNEFVPKLKEAFIDFGEDIDIPANEQLSPCINQAEKILKTLALHIQDSHRGEIIRDGVKIALVGPVNAGKSTLMNYLARRPASIVSHLPGTTRDIVEVTMDIGGLAVSIADTAGIREQQNDPIEQMGIERAINTATAADVKIVVLDATRSVEEQSTEELRKIAEQSSGEWNIVVVNKSDQVMSNEEQPLLQQFQKIPAKNYNLISLHSLYGIDQFLVHLTDMIKCRTNLQNCEEATLITRSRHREHLTTAHRHLQQFIVLANEGFIEAAAEELRTTVREIGKITGKVDVESMLDIVFKDFCVGK